MKLENALSIPVPIVEAWRVLLDIERIAPCVPGATLTARDGDAYSGKIKVKLGPIGLTYDGTVTFISQDEEAGVAVLEATGRELRGNGTAKAVVTCRLVAAGEATDVLMETDLAITGRPAQFGRGALSEVAGTLIGRFADNLAGELTAGATPGAGTGPDVAPASPAAGGKDAATSGVVTNAAPVTSRGPAAPIDLLGAVGGGAVERVGRPMAAGLILLLGLLLIRRLAGRRTARSAP